MKEIVLPSGIKLAGADEQALNAEFARHATAAITEGFCPWHSTPLEAVKAAPPMIAGHCEECRRYWYIRPDLEETGWRLDYDPRTGYPATPEWMQ